MSLLTVKNNMLNTSFTLTSLETGISQLHSSLISIDVKNINKIGKNVDRLKGIIQNTFFNIERMYKINVVELDIFFKRFNTDTTKILATINVGVRNLMRLKSDCIKISSLYEYINSKVPNFNSRIINISSMKTEYGRYFRQLIRDIRTFKNEVVKHNNKLRMGVRI